jgi:hypothetical protein
MAGHKEDARTVVTGKARISQGGVGEGVPNPVAAGTGKGVMASEVIGECWGDNPRYAKGMPNRMVSPFKIPV